MTHPTPTRRGPRLRVEGLEERLTPATALSDSYSVVANTPQTFPAPGVLGNDTADFGPLSASLVAAPPADRGTVSLNPDGSFTFTPAADFVGFTSFQYEAADFSGTSRAFAFVSITNDAPIGAPDAYATDFGDPLVVSAAEGVLANDTDPDNNGVLTAILDQPPPPTAGTLAFAIDGSFTFTPAVGFSGTTTFTYFPDDGLLPPSEGLAPPMPTTVTLTVRPNQPPTPRPDAYTTREGFPLTVPAAGVLTNDTDTDTDPLLAVLATAPPATEGTVALNSDGSFTFTPASGFVGTTGFGYEVLDGFNSPGPVAQVTITVTPNQPPVTGADTYSTTAAVPLVVPPIAGLLANDSDPDGDPLTATLGTPPPATEGSVSLNPDGSFTFTPATGFSGTSTFTYAATDGLDTTAQTATITVLPPNRPPVPGADTYSTDEGLLLVVARADGLLANDSDPDGDTLTAILGTPPPATEGSVVLNLDGSFTFTPAAGFSGPTGFSYTAFDGTDSTPQTVTIRVDPSNRSPVAGADAYTTTAGVPLIVPPIAGLLANDSDPDGDTLTATLGTPPPATEGSVSLNPDGSFTFTPAVGFSGTTTFTYAATDGTDSTTQTATITVAPMNRPPVTGADAYTTAAGVSLIVPASAGVLTNDSDPDGDPLTATLGSPLAATVGFLTMNTDGSFTFVPAAGFSGTVPFAYSTSDGRVSTTGQGTIRVTASTVPPPAVVPPTVPPPAELIAVGAGSGGGPRVRAFAVDGSPRFDVFAFEPTFVGGVRVAVGDVTGDGTDDVVAAAGFGGGPRVVVFDGRTGARVADFFAYEPTFLGGLHVAVADVDGDGRAEIVTGVGSGGGPRVRALRLDGTEVLNFFAFGPASIAGVRVAAADLDGDGRAEVVAAEGPSGMPVVRVFDGRTATVRSEFPAFAAPARGGLFVAALPATANGVGSIVVGADSVPDLTGSILHQLFPVLTNEEVTAPPSVRTFRFAPGIVRTVVPEAEFLAGPPTYLGGVRVAAGGGSAAFDIVTSTGGGTTADAVSLWRIRDGAATLVDTITPFEPDFLGSVYVGG